MSLTISAGTTQALTLPVGATLTLSGMGTHQTSPGAVGETWRKLTRINSQPLTIGPATIASTVNIAADAGGPGVNYSFASSTPTRDTLTASQVTVSRNILPTDNGLIIPVANGVTLTAVAGTLVNFSCVFMPVTGATLSLAFSGGATGNGATSTLTRARTANIAGFAFIQDPTTGQDAFAVGGA